MKFSEFRAGQVIEAGPCGVSDAERLQFTNTYDPPWLHTDAAAAAQGRFGGIIASGWHAWGIAMRLTTDAALHGSESLTSLGLAYLKGIHPVRAGDALSPRGFSAACRPRGPRCRWPARPGRLR